MRLYIYSVIRNKKEMLMNLKKAIELNPIYKRQAKNMHELEYYWDDPDFIELTKE